MKPCVLVSMMLLFVTIGQSQTKKPSQVSKPSCSSAMYFENSTKEVFMETLSRLKKESVSWKKAWPISVPMEDREFVIDAEINNILEDTHAALSDMDYAIATMEKCPKVAELLAITFDLSRIHENLVKMSGLITITDQMRREIAQLSASQRFRNNTSNFQKNISSTIQGIRLYRDGLQSYLFALGTALDKATVK